MITIQTVVGDAIVDDEAITRIIGPLPSLPYTQVFGPGTVAALETLEPPAALVARLHLRMPLAQLAAPNGQPVWIKGSAVALIRPPIAPEIQAPPNITRSVIIVGRQAQAVQQDVPSAVAAIQAVGGLLNPSAQPFSEGLVASFAAPDFEMKDYRPF